MSRIVSKSVLAGLSAGIVSAAFVLGVAAAPATAKEIILTSPTEVILATPAQALAYCQSGKMPGSDIAYIAGPGGLAQYGPSSSCAQQVPAKTAVTKSIEVVGSRVRECNLVGAKNAIQLCQNGGVGEWDIDYIAGKVGKTLSGPGYGCTVNFSTSSIGNAICR
jgi:hypothetical protein